MAAGDGSVHYRCLPRKRKWLTAGPTGVAMSSSRKPRFNAFGILPVTGAECKGVV